MITALVSGHCAPGCAARPVRAPAGPAWSWTPTPTQELPRPIRSRSSRRLLVVAVAAVLGLTSAGVPSPVRAAGPGDSGGDDHLVGRGISDVTGEAAESGMTGCSIFGQKTSGIHQHQGSRAFVVAYGAAADGPRPTGGRRPGPVPLRGRPGSGTKETARPGKRTRNRRHRRGRSRRPEVGGAVPWNPPTGC
ncbi:neutral/alkaline non-lysosomal ceramidase N-terminal domain-containing protein [Streptomyces sp. NPDC019539]|uniref:neutral/alkaline non-lysosomal ceramidase N-terminal domain-containing protein n=1 Tax=Streptomyces sp. NPDC019539 TaxID=3365063 RepID=UPI0037A5A8AF